MSTCNLRAERLMILGLISEMSNEQRQQVEQAAQEIRDLLKRYGGDAGLLAFSLVGFELQEA